MRYQMVVGVRDIVLKYEKCAKLFSLFPYWRYTLDYFLMEIAKSGTEISLSPEDIGVQLDALWNSDECEMYEVPSCDPMTPPLFVEGRIIMSHWLSAILTRIAGRWDTLFLTLPPKSFCHSIGVAGWVGFDLLLEFHFTQPRYSVAGNISF